MGNMEDVPGRGYLSRPAAAETVLAGTVQILGIHTSKLLEGTRIPIPRSASSRLFIDV
jgi:hypothetical protein